MRYIFRHWCYKLPFCLWHDVGSLRCSSNIINRGQDVRRYLWEWAIFQRNEFIVKHDAAVERIDSHIKSSLLIFFFQHIFFVF